MPFSHSAVHITLHFDAPYRLLHFCEQLSVPSEAVPPPPEEDEPDELEDEEPELPEPEEELEPEDDDELLELAGGGVGQEEQQVRVPPQPSEQE